MAKIKRNRLFTIFTSKILLAIKKNPFLSTILLIGLLLRIIGTNPGYYMHGYEVIYGDSITMILDRTIGLSYTNLAYPPLVFWIMALGFAFVFIPIAWAGYILGHLPQFLELVNEGIAGNIDFWLRFDQIFNSEILGTRYWQNAMYWGRYITALFGVGVVFLTYSIQTTKVFKIKFSVVLERKWEKKRKK